MAEEDHIILDSLICDVLRRNILFSGIWQTQGNGASCPHSLKLYEEQLQKLNVPVEYSVSHAFVPSFMEDWVFYQVWPKRN